VFLHAVDGFHFVHRQVALVFQLRVLGLAAGFRLGCGDGLFQRHGHIRHGAARLAVVVGAAVDDAAVVRADVHFLLRRAVGDFHFIVAAAVFMAEVHFHRLPFGLGGGIIHRLRRADFRLGEGGLLGAGDDACGIRARVGRGEEGGGGNGGDDGFFIAFQHVCGFHHFSLCRSFGFGGGIRVVRGRLVHRSTFSLMIFKSG
jgi:hypothetical protein